LSFYYGRLPTLISCSSWYCSLGMGMMKKLQVVQNKVVRFVLDLGPNSRINCDILDKVNMLSVTDLSLSKNSVHCNPKRLLFPFKPSNSTFQVLPFFTWNPYIMGLGLWCVTHHGVRIMVCNTSLFCDMSHSNIYIHIWINMAPRTAENALILWDKINICW
jgi:hypothetical protein